jgi:hypothetical protein
LVYNLAICAVTNELVNEEYNFKVTDDDFEAGFKFWPFYKCRAKAIRLYDCGEHGMECSISINICKMNVTWATKDDEKTILEMIEDLWCVFVSEPRFYNYLKTRK